MISIIIVVMNVGTLIINISAIKINDIQYSIYMVVTTALPLYRIIIILYQVSLMLLV